MRQLIFLFLSVVVFTKGSYSQRLLSQSKTAFYTIHVIQDTNLGKIYFSLKNLNIVDQPMKRAVIRDYSKEPHHLKITIIDKLKNKQVVFTEFPLKKEIELYDDDTKEIALKRIFLTEADITFRIPFYADYKKIKITEIDNFKKGKTTTLKHDK